VAESEGVPFVIDISVAASLLQERELEYVYRAQPNSWSQSAHHVEGLTAVADQAGLDIETVGLFYVDTTYGQAIRDGLERALEGTDMEIVETASIGFGGTADSQVTRFRQADPDAIFPTVFTNQMLELVKSMQDQNYWPDVFAACASGGMYTENFQKMGDVINGALSSGYQIDLTQEKAQRINERYMETFDTPPMKGNIGMAYTTAEVVIEAFEQAGSADPEVLRRTLDDITVDEHIMAMPPISFTERGENANPLSVMNQIQDMEAQVIYPEQYATVEVQPELIGRN
jgi:branched-chain amino acid transport system substrate-binding protein